MIGQPRKRSSSISRLEAARTNGARRPFFFISLFVAVAVGAGFEIERYEALRYARLLQLSLLLLVLVASTVLIRGAIRNGLILASSIFTGLFLIEGGCLILETQGPTFDSGGLYAARPVVGYGASGPGVYEIRKFDPQGRKIYDVHVTINDNLIRKTDSAEGAGAIAFFGDSQTLGEGVEDKDTLEQSFADLLGRKVPVLNLGFSGWSPAQNLAALQADLYEPLLKDPRRFILMTAAWHVERTACKAGFSTRSPRYVIARGALVHEGSCNTRIANAIHAVLRRFAFYRVLVTAVATTPLRQDVETYLKIVETFVEIAKRKYSVDTTILFFPYGDDYLKTTGYRERQMIDAFRKAGADVLIDDLPPIPDASLYYIQGDGHPTGLSNRARAKLLLDHLQIVAPWVLKPDITAEH